MIVLDTSLLVDAFTADQRAAPDVRRAIENGQRLVFPALVLYEWLRGPRIAPEIALQEQMFPAELALPFQPEDAALSARLYRSVRRARGREIDLAIAACAINRNALLWSSNRADFSDIPGLTLYLP